MHPIHLAEQCPDEKTTITALLHDVLEDCADYTPERLAGYGFPEEILVALQLLTHEKDMPYMDYIKRLSVNPIARCVKILDLTHNLDDSRIDDDVPDRVKEHLLQKRELYKDALTLLKKIDRLAEMSLEISEA